MTRITNSAQIMALLREQLKRTGPGAKPAGKAATAKADAVGTRPLDRLRERATVGGLSGEELDRAIIRGLLTEQFGDAISNDPGFAAIADEVMRIIGAMPEGRELMESAAAALQAREASG